MGDRIPEDAYTYNWDDSVVSIESRYWRFVLENFICSANEIYNHCLTTQNARHTREMVALCQNYAFDFVTLYEYCRVQRAGINIPFPQRNAYVYHASDLLNHVADLVDDSQSQIHYTAPTAVLRRTAKFKSDITLRKKKKGFNVLAAPFIPALKNDETVTSRINKEWLNNELSQQQQQQRSSRQEQTWAPVIPQVPQLSVPHFHVPYTNLVHYPIGNFVTHQISQSNYPGSYLSPGDSNHSHCDGNELYNVNNSVQQPIFANTAVQVEITNTDHSSEEDAGKDEREKKENPTDTSSDEDVKSTTDELKQRLSDTATLTEVLTIEDKSSINNDIKPEKNINTDVSSSKLTEKNCTLEEKPIETIIFATCPHLETENLNNNETFPKEQPVEKELERNIFFEENEICKENSDTEDSDGWQKVKGRNRTNDFQTNERITMHRKSSCNISASPEDFPLLNKFEQPEKQPDTSRKSCKKKQSPIKETVENEILNEEFTEISTNSENISETIYENPESLGGQPLTTEWRDILLKGLNKEDTTKKTFTSCRPIKAGEPIKNHIFKDVRNIEKKNSFEELIPNLIVKSIPPKVTILNVGKPKRIFTKRKRSLQEFPCDDDFNDFLPEAIDENLEVINIDEKVNNNDTDINGGGEDIENLEILPGVATITDETLKTNLDDIVTEPIVSIPELNVITESLTSAHDLDNSVLLLSPEQILSPQSESILDCIEKVENEILSDQEINAHSPIKFSTIDDGLLFPEPESFNSLHSKFINYINSLPRTAQLEEINSVWRMLSEEEKSDVYNSNLALSSPDEFEYLCRKNPLAAAHLQIQITTKLRQIRETEAKQQQAYEKRLQLLQCKTAKVRELVQKVEEAKAAQYKLALQRKSQIDLKLKKAEENRNMYLSIIRRKAHDEEEKLKEIAFINELEAQNRRHDSLALRQEHEERLQCLIEERQRRVEEKAAKEAAVEERRRVLEAERQEKLEKMKEKRRRKEEIIDRKQQEKEKERLVIAREKAREREERLQARQAAQLATMEELQKRIQQKQEESARRHEENIELIRQKALEISLHRNPAVDDIATNSAQCSKTDEHQKSDTQGNITIDKLKTNLKKRCKKLKTRLENRGAEYVKKMYDQESIDDAAKSKHPLVRIMNDFTKILADDLSFVEKKKALAERLLNDLGSYLERKPDLLTLQTFLKLNGFPTMGIFLEKFCQLSSAKAVSFKRIFNKICAIYQTLLQYNSDDCIKFIVGSANILKLIDALNFSCSMINTGSKKFVNITEAILVTVHVAMNRIGMCASKLADKEEAIYQTMISDSVSYTLICGVTRKITDIFKMSVLDEGSKIVENIPNFVEFLSSLIDPNFQSNDVIRTLKSSDCLGTVSLLYEGLQKMTPTSILPSYTHGVINLLLKFAKLDINAFQETLGAEGMGLQLRAIASSVMAFCSVNKGFDGLLLAVIEIVGYFAIHSHQNQTLIQSGLQPTILQQLVNLPFKYFCETDFKLKLYATLIACSFNNATNKVIVENEFSYKELETFIESPNVENISPLMKIFLQKKSVE